MLNKPTDDILARLAAFRRRQRWVAALDQIVRLWLGAVLGVLAFDGARMADIGARAAGVAGAAAFLLASCWRLRARAAAWNEGRTLLAQARNVERHAQGMNGDLVTAVAGLGAPSPDLWRKVVTRAWTELQAVDPAAVAPLKPLRVLAVVSVVLSGAAAFRPHVGQNVPVVATDAATDSANAYVGDLSVRYVYPAYTGLPPREVRNGTGDVSAVEGTVVDVSMRTADVVGQAALELDGERLAARVDENGRRVVGTFALHNAVSSYRALLKVADRWQTSPLYAATAEPDLPPVATWMSPPDQPMAVPLDAPIPLGWEAADDFGVERIELLVDGVAVPLFEAEQRTPRIDGNPLTSPRGLGLMVGDRVTLRLQAWDNDTVSGQKVGQSSDVHIVVGEDSRAVRLSQEQHDAIIDHATSVLAHLLKQPSSPNASRRAVGAWGRGVQKASQPFHATVVATWGDRPVAEAFHLMASRSLQAVLGVVDWTTLTLDADRGGSLTRWEQTSLTSKETAAVSTLELAISAMIWLDEMQALQDLARFQGRLRALAAELRADATRAEATATDASLAETRRLLVGLASLLSRLEAHALSQTLAIRVGESLALQDEIAAPASDEGGVLTLRLALALDDMAAILAFHEESRREQASETMQQVRDVLEDMKALLQTLGQARKELTLLQAGDAASPDAPAWIDQQIGLTARIVEIGTAARAAAAELPIPALGLADAIQHAEDRASQAALMLGGGDVNAARGAHEEARNAWAEAIRILEAAMVRSGQVGNGTQDASAGVADETATPVPMSWSEDLGPYADPDAYLKALIEGQRGSHDDDAARARRRYYEDLIRP